jgi:hypothetical protein
MYVLFVSPRSCFHGITLDYYDVFKTESVCMHFTVCMNLNMCVCMEEGVTSEDYIALYDDMTFLGMFF